MKIGILTKPNQKGQIVIPKKLRDDLGINKDVPLNLVIKGRGIYLEPIKEFVPKIESEDIYLKVLEKTRGRWSKENWQKLRKKRKAIELSASEKRKQAW